MSSFKSSHTLTPSFPSFHEELTQIVAAYIGRLPIVIDSKVTVKVWGRSQTFHAEPLTIHRLDDMRVADLPSIFHERVFERVNGTRQEDYLTDLPIEVISITVTVSKVVELDFVCLFLVSVCLSVVNLILGNRLQLMSSHKLTPEGT